MFVGGGISLQLSTDVCRRLHKFTDVYRCL